MKEEVEDNDPCEDPLSIDLSIVKEEALDIDDVTEYPWPENIKNENEIYIKNEEDVNHWDQDEEIPDTVSSPLKIQRRRRRRAAPIVKPKHWCSICKCKQESAHALAIHRLELHKSNARYSCSYCPRMFFHHSNRRRHELTHLGPLPRHNCTMCSRTYARKSGLEAHVRSAHTGERPYVCQYCNMTFSRDFCYRTHMYIHSGERPYACKECPRAFSSKSDLVRHNRMHTGEKPYSCDKCPKTFRVKGLLRQHLATHSGEKPLPCGLCPKMFRIGTNVALHRGRHILNAKMLKVHKCDTCQREFTRKGNLKEHMKRHLLGKTLKCHYCALYFKTTADLAKHENIHTRDTVYKCDTCGRSFLRKHRMRSHILLSHLTPPKPKKPTKCLACGRDYKFPSQLKFHLRGKRCREILKRLKKENISD